MFKLIKQAHSVNKNKLELYKNDTGFSNPILIIGGFHGDEPQGVVALENFLTKEVSAKNETYILPCLNPDGKSANTRVNANNVDLNRNFPTKNWEFSAQDDYFGGTSPASEPETKFVAQIIDEITPKLILTLHAPYKIVNFDGPAEPFCPEIAKIMDYPIQNDIGYPTPGSFGTYCGIERRIPTITLEMGEDEAASWQYDRLEKVFTYLMTL